MDGTNTLVFGLTGTNDETRRYSNTGGNIISFSLYFKRDLNLHEVRQSKLDVDRITKFLKEHWQKTILEFQSISGIRRYESIIFDRATVAGFFVQCPIFEREEYEARFHEKWVHDGPDPDFRTECPQKFMLALMKLICHHLLVPGGVLVASVSQFVHDTLAGIRGMFRTSEILSSDSVLVKKVLKPFDGDSRDLVIMVFTDFMPLQQV